MTASKNQIHGENWLARTGNYATHPSPRGVNLLGWGEEEKLTPRQQLECLQLKAKRLQEQIVACADKAERKRLGVEVNDVNLRINALKKEVTGVRKGRKDLHLHMIDIIRETSTKLEWKRLMDEAVRRHDADQEAGQ